MSKLLINIPYLETGDVNPDGSLPTSITGGKPALVMIQGNFCGYCTKAKPDFQQLAQHPEFAVLTVQIDGGQGDQGATQAISKVNSAKGVPSYVMYGKDGKFVGMYNGGRDYASMLNAMKSM
jgi:thiol-disulfide isomerase/thioredoxin